MSKILLTFVLLIGEIWLKQLEKDNPSKDSLRWKYAFRGREIYPTMKHGVMVTL